MRYRQFLAGLLLFWVSTTAVAGTIRDDRDSQLYLNLATQSQYASVGRIDTHTTTGVLIGSGTLIAPQFVLTAGHLVDHLTSLTFSLAGNSYSAAHWLANPNWNGNLTNGYDLAVVELNSAVMNVTPATRYLGASELNSLGTYVGYGRTGTGLTGATSLTGQKWAGINMLDALYNNNQRLLTADFDNPHTATASSQGSALPTNLEYMIGPGDSGGGMFIDTVAGVRLAGVNSFGAAFDGQFNARYGDIAGTVRVSLFNNWIDQAMATLGALSAGGSATPLLSVPEPSSGLLAGIALAVIVLAALRRPTKSRLARESAGNPSFVDGFTGERSGVL